MRHSLWLLPWLARWTWASLILVFAVNQALVFAGYVLPWGQMSYWLVGKLIDAPVLGAIVSGLFGDFHSDQTRAIFAISWLFMFGILLADLAAMQVPRLRDRPRRDIILTVDTSTQ